MKLYLSSYRLGDETQRLLAMAGSGPIAVIPNALDTIEGAALRQAVIDRGVADLAALGLESTVLDLRVCFGKADCIFERMTPFNKAFVTGGNVFVLRRAMAQSGFDKFLSAQSSNPGFLYAGYSAGSCVCSPTLKGLHLVDDPTVVPEGYGVAPIYEGLAFIPYLFVPHYQSDHRESGVINVVVSYCIDNKIPFCAYRDGEVLLEKGD